jgi:hypothetical protein
MVLQEQQVHKVLKDSLDPRDQQECKVPKVSLESPDSLDPRDQQESKDLKERKVLLEPQDQPVLKDYKVQLV